MIFIFTTDGMQKIPDPDYNKELSAVHRLGIEYLLFDFDSFKEGNIKVAFKYINKQRETKRAIYRGWMMTPPEYEQFFLALLEKNIVLVNSPFEYERGHCLYNVYDAIKDYTPESTFIFAEDMNDTLLAKALQPFHGKPVFFRDFYKSDKMRWKSAAFIPDGKDTAHVQKVIESFKEYRSIKGGYVFREYIPLKVIGKHPYPGVDTPIANEWRAYFLNDELIDLSPYWEEGNYDGVEKPPIDKFIPVVENINSSFFTMDLAETKNGNWIIIEIGDGQVSGLTRDCGHEQFYKNIIGNKNG